MPSPRRAVPLLAALALTGITLLSGCGGGDDPSSASTPSAPAGTTGEQPAATPHKTAATAAYKDPMEVAKKIRQAHLGCTAPKRTESLGSGKVICGGSANISIEFYSDAEAFTQVKQTLCQMAATTVVVADPGRHWMVTTLSTAVTKRVQKAVGGRLVKAC
jgi:hypothetical protein